MNITYDEVYEIAAEVAEETITKFLKNLLKLVPTAEDVVGDIKEAQYEELKQLRSKRELPEQKSKRAKIRESIKAQPMILREEEDYDEEEEDEFESIAHPGRSRLNESLEDSLSDALDEIPLENSDLYGGARSSAVDDSQVVSMNGLDM